MMGRPMGAGSAAAAQSSMYEEEKKEEDASMQSQFDIPTCVYCMGHFTSAEQNSGQVQMFLADGCYHQFHIDCFKNYAKKTLLTKLPSGEFADCRCRKCNTIVQAEDLRDALGQEML